MKKYIRSGRVAFLHKLMAQRNYIRGWRERRGMSQTALAKMSGVSRSVISRLENGEQPYREDLLVPLAFSLDCQPYQLIECDPDERDIQTLRRLEFLNSEPMRHWIKAFQDAA